MIFYLLFFLTFLQQTYSFAYNTVEGSGMKSFVRGTGTESKSFIIDKSDFYDAAFVGYFKFNTMDPTKWYSLMRLQIASEGYTFLHYYTIGVAPYLWMITDYDNYDENTNYGPAIEVNRWYQFGFGYKHATKHYYAFYQASYLGSSLNIPQRDRQLNPDITKLELCISCQPLEYKFSKFDGTYASIKMITNFDKDQPLKILINEFNMTDQLLRNSFFITQAVYDYVKLNFFTTDFDVKCTTTPSRIYFDGVCIDPSSCQNIVYFKTSQFGQINNVFYNQSKNQCDTCKDNCQQCDTNAICLQCDFGFYLDTNNNLCKKCTDNTFYNPSNQLCVSNCPTGYQKDYINQICSNNFNPFYHLLNPVLVKRNFISNEGFLLKDSSNNIASDQFAECYLENQSFGSYTFLGGQNTLSSNYLEKQILQLPKNFKKQIFFQAIVYNNGIQGDFNLLVNNLSIPLASYKKIFTNQQLCTDNQSVSLYELVYDINDSSTDLQIQITSNKNGWGIRNFSMNITKCHSTCLDCTTDGNPWSCTSCQMQATSVKINNNCACKKGEYTQFQNCYTSPCYSCAACPPNCNSCEDQTGKCTSCENGFSVQNGVCIINSSCQQYYGLDPGSSYCIKQKDFGLTQFVKDKIRPNLQFWQYSALPNQYYQCGNRIFAPYMHGTNTAKLVIELQNYLLFHYQVEILLTATNLDYNAQTDYFNYFIDNVLVKKTNYLTTSTNSLCLAASQGETLVNEILVLPKKTTTLSFVVESHLTANFMSFLDITINYVRCHASCSNCLAGTSCTSCIDNASQDATKGNFCYCNDGYYFTYDWNNSSGLCLKCNNFCQTCNGPNITDCLTCKESYKLVNNVCVSACNSNQFWDFILHKCVDCSDCCSTCNGTNSNSCLSCYTDYMTLNSSNCKFNSDNKVCNSCNSNVSNSLCGGTQTNHNYCLTRGWVAFNTNTCVYCKVADSNGYCGGSSQYNTVCNQYGYFYSSTTGTCLSCSQASGTDCGDSSIRNLCISNKWIYESLSNCISCLLTTNPLCCHSSCNTCNGQYENNCLSCYGAQILFNNYCIDKCPNGYKLNPNTNTCESCPIFIGVPECNNCSPDCNTCTASSITKCKTCYNSRELNLQTSKCDCKDPEDTRKTFYECSINNQAVLDIKLSNTSAKMTIDFGKILIDLSGLNSQESSNSVCRAIFDQSNLNLIGINSKCQLLSNMINIDLDDTATIMHGDTLNFLPNVLKFKENSNMAINKFLNNITYQEPISNTAVVFIYNKLENSCNDYRIIKDKINNDSNRGFKTITWTLLNPTTNQDDIQIQTILSQASSSKQSSVIIPKGIISINTQKTIKVEYLLKNTFAGTQQFVFQVKTYKNIVSQFKSDMQIPYYRFQDFTISLTYGIQYCDANANQLNTNDPIDISITSPQSTKINTQLKNSSQTEVSFKVNKFSFESNKNNQIDALITISNDPTIKSTQQLEFKTEPSALIVKIEGGNRKIDYKSKLTITSKVRDLDLEDETANQGVTQTWTCTDPSDPSKQCIDQNNKPFTFDQINPIIPPSTFNPYTVIKVQLKGEKDQRNQIDQIVILFIEFDLPLLDVTLKLIDPFTQTVNLNEEIFTVLNYDTKVNPDILSFSSTILYENDVVGAIKFDYTKLRFQLWDYYSEFKRQNPSVTIRFSVFNPYYFMPSISIVNLKINFPPEQCVFNISPIPIASSPVYSLQTIFTLTFSGCVDINLPLSYQFFMYKSQSDLDYEIKNPKQVKRRQLNNQSHETSFVTILPSGNLVIMAVASDSLQALYNTTTSIVVTSSNMNENQYINIIDNALKLNGKTNDEIITSLSLIAEDLSQRVDLKTSPIINDRKVLIIKALKNASLALPAFSTFSSLSDKAISSLIESGVKFDTQQETSQLNSLASSLEEDWSTTPYESLPDIKKSLRNQQMYDYFQIIDKIVGNSQQQNSNIYSLQLDISNKIGEKMNYNTLPNEDPKIFKGNKLRLHSQKITEKNLCRYLFCSDYVPIDSQTGTPTIYNIAYKTHTENPFKNDPSYQNFTTVLQKNIGNQQPVVFPVINPSIAPTTTPSPNSLINTNNVQFTFQGKEEKPGLSCFTKNNGSWTQSGCKLVFNKKNNQYSCLCESLGPTTIVNDLDALVNNKNLQTAFGSQGIENISNFTEFYKYIAFWLIVAKTIGFVVLYFKGRSLDLAQKKIGDNIENKITKKLNNNKIYPNDISINGKNQKGFNNKIQLSSQQSFMEEQRTKKSRKQVKLSSLNNLNTEEPFTLLQIKQQSKFSIIESNTQQKKEGSNAEINNKNENDKISNNVEDKPISLKQENQSNQLNQEQQITTTQQQERQKIPSIEALNQIETDERNQKLQSGMMQGDSENNIPPQGNQNESFNNTSKTNQKKKFADLSEGEFSEKSQKFMQLNLFKQTVFFHNFFGIFFVYDQSMPRTLRFSCFYVRLIHSFAIAIIFDQTYSPIQLIALSIANSILIMICLTLLEIVVKKLSKYALAFTLLILLGFYYYVILSIVSGQQPNISNKSIGTYLIFASFDLLVVSFLSASIQRLIAIRTIKKQKLQTCSQKIFELLHIQLILSSIL